MQDLRVAVVTLTPKYLNVNANLEAVCAWSERAVGAGAQLVLFPEGFLTGYDLTAKEQTAVTLDSPEMQTITRLAEQRNLVIGLGLLERAAEGFYITQAYVGTGVRQYHRKAHLTGWDKQHCQPGKTLDLQDVGRAKLGTLICYDSAFPAAAETLVRKGADILIQPSCHGKWARDVAPAQRPAEILKRKEHILKYWRARAYDYSTYAIYLNHCGVTSRGEWFPSYVGIYGPDGEIIAEHVGEEEQMVVADLSAERLEQCRREEIGHYSTMPDARPELYWTHSAGANERT